MPLHHPALLRLQRAALLEDGLGDRDLADVVRRKPYSRLGSSIAAARCLGQLDREWTRTVVACGLASPECRSCGDRLAVGLLEELPLRRSARTISLRSRA
jgi:hypothetical protein